MSREILARSGAYTLTEFAGPQGRRYIQITDTRHDPVADRYISLPVDCLKALVADLTDYLDPKA